MNSEKSEETVEHPLPFPLQSTARDFMGSTRSFGTPINTLEQEQPGVDLSEILPWDIPDPPTDEEEEEEEVDEEFVEAIKDLPETTLELLKIAACLGSLDKRLLEASTREDVSYHLSNAACHGVVVYKDSLPEESIFVSDATLDSLYRLIPQDERRHQHVAIGRSLVKNLSQKELEEFFYIVLRQFHLGVHHLTGQSERNAIAMLCLRAGELAVSRGDFPLASRYLDFGISLLDCSSWKDEYNLTLALYNGLSEVESSQSHFARVNDLVAQVLENARCFRDTLRARASRIYSLSTRYQMAEAVQESLEVLNHLGEKFPAEPRRYHVARELIRVWRLLKGKTNEMILRMPLMTDPDKIAVLQILNLLFPGAYRTCPKLWGLIVLRVVRLTMLYGLSSASAIGFAFYSAISSMITGNIDGSYRYAELALALVDKLNAKEWIPRVYLGVYGHTSSYKYYLRDAYPQFLLAHQVGLQTGDIEISSMAANIYCMLHVFSGDFLVDLEKEAIGFSQIFFQRNQETALRMILPCIQFAQNLMGKSDDPMKLVGDMIKDEATFSDLLAQATKSHDEISVAFVNYYLLVLAYVFNDYDAAAEEALRMERITRPPYLHPSMSNPYTFYSLALLAVCNNHKGCARQKMLATAKRCIRKLAKFSLHTPENCLGKTFLLQAELAAAKGKIQEARCNYLSAISIADRLGDFMIHAVACERAARFCKECGDESAAVRYFGEARTAYLEWGALAKVEQLDKETPELLVDSNGGNRDLTGI